MGSNSSDMSDSRKSGGAYSGAATGVVQHWLLVPPRGCAAYGAFASSSGSVHARVRFCVIKLRTTAVHVQIVARYFVSVAGVPMLCCRSVMYILTARSRPLGKPLPSTCPWVLDTATALEQTDSATGSSSAATTSPTPLPAPPCCAAVSAGTSTPHGMYSTSIT